MAIIRSLLIVCFLSFSVACVETKVRGYTDTNYATYQVNSVAILAISPDIGLSDSIEQGLSEGLKSSNIKSVMSRDTVPPTRAYTDDEIKEAFSRRGINSLLIVNVGGSTKSSKIVGYQSYGSAYSDTTGSVYASGNTAYLNANTRTTSSQTTTAIQKYSRDTVADIYCMTLPQGM